MSIKLIIIGGGIGAFEVMGIIEDINKITHRYEILGVLDDNPKLQNSRLEGVPILGSLTRATEFRGVKFIFAIGSIHTQKVRKELQARLGLRQTDFETLIHPTAIIDKTARIGYGCILHARVTIGCNVTIKDFVIIAVASTLGPGVFINNFSMITSHVLLLSRVSIEECVFIGSASCIIEDVKIGNNARIGVGSVVGRNVESDMLAIGNPSRLLGRN